MINQVIQMISEIKNDPALLEKLNGQSDIIEETGDGLFTIN